MKKNFLPTFTMIMGIPILWIHYFNEPLGFSFYKLSLLIFALSGSIMLTLIIMKNDKPTGDKS